MIINSTSERNIMLSVVVPTYNEEHALPILVKRLIQTFEKNGLEGEIIIVNDGSVDETGKIAEALSKKHGQIRVFHHKRKMGKTAALHTGFVNSSKDILVMIDSDLQYAPEDLPKFLAKIQQGFDVVNGWRKHRKDSMMIKKIPSSIYNFISRISFGMALHDFNSGFKVLKREVIENVNLRRGQHRFILNLAHYEGWKVGEVEIQHFPRKHGKTKFGASRMFWGFFDLIALRLQLAFTERPMALFGLLGLILLLAGFIFGVDVMILNLVYGEPFAFHLARLLLAVILGIAGLQSLLFGFIADMIANLRSEQQKRNKNSNINQK